MTNGQQKESTVEIGNTLENALYDYLEREIKSDSSVLGTHKPENCKLYKKKKSWCHEREGEVEFDVVLEILRPGATDPQLSVIFECKNYKSAVQEKIISEFSDKLSRIYRHNCKGIIVTPAPLQSGAMNLLKKRGLGLIKLLPTGAMEFVLERRNYSNSFDRKFLEKQILENGFRDTDYVKSLPFSAYYGDEFFDTFTNFLTAVADHTREKISYKKIQIPFISYADINKISNSIHREINYKKGPVDLRECCHHLDILLEHSEAKILNSCNQNILGIADLQNRKILISKDDSLVRKRFTTAHEIGHFALGHKRYISKDSIVENDLVFDTSDNSWLNRLEYQANCFASCLILPEAEFLERLKFHKRELGLTDRGHGNIFVDNQHCNSETYDKILTGMSYYFCASKVAVEIKIKKLNLLNDNRHSFKQLDY